MDKDKSTELEKVFNVILKKKFPELKEFYVNYDQFDKYQVGVNISYDDLLSGNQDKIKKEIIDISKMILTGRGEKVIRVYFYDAN